MFELPVGNTRARGIVHETRTSLDVVGRGTEGMEIDEGRPIAAMYGTTGRSQSRSNLSLHRRERSVQVFSDRAPPDIGNRILGKRV